MRDLFVILSGTFRNLEFRGGKVAEKSGQIFQYRASTATKRKIEPPVPCQKSLIDESNQPARSNFF